MDRKVQKADEKLLLTSEEVIELLGLRSRTMINYLINKWGLPYIKIGKFIRFPVQDIKKWLEEKGEKIVI